MFVSIYYKPSLFNAHTMIFIVHIFMNVNKLCLNQHFIIINVRRSRVVMDQRLKKSRSAATGAAPVVTVQADAGVTVPVAVAALESDMYVPAGGACWVGAGLAQR